MRALQHAALHADVALACRAATPLTKLVRQTTGLWLQSKLCKRVFAPPPATEAPAFESQIGDGVQDSLPPIAW
ncbi:hypothetical protein DIPPA_04426 [Diplonema papillatum]|nr:hypothetical protein DIPPA_04426 [Diplonema papillatum]